MYTWGRKVCVHVGVNSLASEFLNFKEQVSISVSPPLLELNVVHLVSLLKLYFNYLCEKF